jgi:hypothetical protein
MVIYVYRACNCISDRLRLLMVIYVDRACNCTSKDPVHQICNTESMYICYHEKTQSIRYTIPIISTYVTKRRLSESDIRYCLSDELSLLMVIYVDRVGIVYLID